jgi:hypothetical protein
MDKCILSEADKWCYKTDSLPEWNNSANVTLEDQYKAGGNNNRKQYGFM